MKIMKPTKLTSVATELEADMMIELLGRNQISCMKKDNFSGGYLNVYSGYSIYGCELFVDEDDLDRAKEVIKTMEIPLSKEDYENFEQEALNTKSSQIDEYDAHLANDGIANPMTRFIIHAYQFRRVIAGLILIGAIVSVLLSQILGK